MMLVIRSLIFDIWLYVWLAFIGILFSPVALFSRDGAYWVMRLYANHVMWMLRNLCGIHSEVRGEPPQDEVLIASKHHSFIDNVIIFLEVPRAKFVMKKSLKWAPVFGWYVTRVGAVPVHRGKGERAVRSMKEGLAAQRDEKGQIIIYPQGTRVAPGVERPYKIGAWRLYRDFGLDCVPVALNTGIFWGRQTLLRYPGTMIVEFLERIPPGLDSEPFMEQLEARIETASDRLIAEARAAGYGANNARR